MDLHHFLVSPKIGFKSVNDHHDFNQQGLVPPIQSNQDAITTQFFVKWMQIANGLDYIDHTFGTSGMGNRDSQLEISQRLTKMQKKKQEN